jgi:hypothetical protein
MHGWLPLGVDWKPPAEFAKDERSHVAGGDGAARDQRDD